jgi:hypothetical protein
MNGEVRQVTVDDIHAAVDDISRPKADPTDSNQVGAPMSGVVVEIRVHDGLEVKKGDPIAVLSAMKMVSSISKSAGTSRFTDNFCSIRKWLFLHLIMARLPACRLRKEIRSMDKT